jgi:hypothetical protein
MDMAQNLDNGRRLVMKETSTAGTAKHKAGSAVAKRDGNGKTAREAWLMA